MFAEQGHVLAREPSRGDSFSIFDEIDQTFLDDAGTRFRTESIERLPAEFEAVLRWTGAVSHRLTLGTDKSAHVRVRPHESKVTDEGIRFIKDRLPKELAVDLAAKENAGLLKLLNKAMTAKQSFPVDKVVVEMVTAEGRVAIPLDAWNQLQPGRRFQGTHPLLEAMMGLEIKGFGKSAIDWGLGDYLKVKDAQAGGKIKNNYAGSTATPDVPLFKALGKDTLWNEPKYQRLLTGWDRAPRDFPTTAHKLMQVAKDTVQMRKDNPLGAQVIATRDIPDAMLQRDILAREGVDAPYLTAKTPRHVAKEILARIGEPGRVTIIAKGYRGTNI
ncbi:MAG: hypothetical protein ACRDJK_14165, partial [Actinomycetota bacterium]